MRLRIFSVVVLLAASILPGSVLSQQWTVSTFVAGPAGLDDSIARDSAGNLYVSRYDGSIVRKVTPEGVVSTYVRGLQSPNGLTVASDGTLYVPNATGNRITRVAPDGTPDHEYLTGLSNPAGVALNAAEDTLYVSQYQSSRIVRFPIQDPDDREVFASGSPLDGPVGLVFGPDGSLFVGNFDNGNVIRIEQDGSAEVFAHVPSYMGSLTIAGSELFATSFSTNRIYRIGADGVAQVIAGATTAGSVDGPGPEARFDGPNGILASVGGDTLFVSDYNTEALRMIVREISTDREREPFREPPAPYPNPFRSELMIESSPEEDVKIFDMLGREVAAFSGSTSVIRWDGTDSAGGDVPPGLYVIVRGRSASIVVKAHHR